jgi:serine/threonine protein kinase/nucleoside phosphorylase
VTEVDILIATALTQEHQVATAVLDKTAQLLEQTDEYARIYRYQTTSNHAYRIALASAHQMSAHKMSTFLTTTLQHLQPALAVLVGIAAAVDTEVVSLGDVPFSSHVISYDDIAVDGGHMTFRTEGYPAAPEIRRSTHALKSSPTAYQEWQNSCSEIIPILLQRLNALQRTKISPPPSPLDAPHLVVEVSAGGPFLVRDESFRDTLRSPQSRHIPTKQTIAATGVVHPKLVSLEMESHGFMHAAQECGISACVLKGISDDGDSDKQELEKKTGGFFRAYACSNAVLAILHILRQRPQLRTRGMRPSHSGNEPAAAHTKPQTRAGSPRANILKERRERDHGLKKNDLLATDRYRLDAEIGQGLFGTVWRAFDMHQGEQVAIKILHRQWMPDKSRVDRFTQGAEKMALMDHPNIVKVIQGPTKEDGDILYFVMQIVSGRTFLEAVEDPAFDTATRLRIIAQVCDAVQHAHDRGVIHRDLAPRNVLIGDDGIAKLIDFDLVMATDITGGTRLHAAMGTPPYAAPEVRVDASGASAASDIYSLGMLVALAGVGPRKIETFSREHDKSVDQLPLPTPARKAVMRATALDPSKRHGNATAFRKQIDESIQILAKLDINHGWVLGLSLKCRDTFESSIEHVLSYGDINKIPTAVAKVASAALQHIESDPQRRTPWNGSSLIEWSKKASVQGIEPTGPERSVLTLLLTRIMTMIMDRWLLHWNATEAISHGKIVLGILLGVLPSDQEELLETIENGHHLWATTKMDKIMLEYGISNPDFDRHDSSPKPRAARTPITDGLIEEESLLLKLEQRLALLGCPPWFNDDIRAQLRNSPENDGFFVSKRTVATKDALLRTRLPRTRSDLDGWRRALAIAAEGSSFRVRSLEKWADFVRYVAQPGSSRTWTNLTDISAVLRRCGHTINHAFFPDGGGLDLDDARVLPNDLIELSFDGIPHIGHIQRLSLEVFPDDETGEWAYLFLEFSDAEYLRDADPGLDVEGLGSFCEPAWEVGIGEYEYNDGSGAPHSLARRITWVTGGNMVIVAKGSVYNANNSTYDGRQGATSRVDFFRYIETIYRAIMDAGVMPNALGVIGAIEPTPY